MNTTLNAGTHYEVLGVPMNATPAQIKKAYRSRARATHPDYGGTNEAFQDVEFAYRTLNDESTRAAYDSELINNNAQSAAPQQTHVAQYVHRGAFNEHGARATRVERLEVNCERIDAEYGVPSARYRLRRYHDLVTDATHRAAPLRRSAPGWSAPVTVLAALVATLAPRWGRLVESADPRVAVAQASFVVALASLALWSALAVRRRRGPLPRVEVAVVAAASLAAMCLIPEVSSAGVERTAAGAAAAYGAWTVLHCQLRLPMTPRAARQYRAWVGENWDVWRDMRDLRKSASRAGHQDAMAGARRRVAP